MSYVIAIAGGSASGKSTLAGALAEELKEGFTVEVVVMDVFMRRDDPHGPHFQFAFEGKRTFNANDPDSVDVAAILVAIESSSAEIVIVEGLMALVREEIRERAQLRLYVGLDDDVRAVRRIERDIRIGRGGGDPAYIAAYYLECARVGHALYVEPSKRFADLLVRGDAEFARTGVLIADAVRGAIGRERNIQE